MNKINTINFKQPKYILPAILYPLLLVTGYFVIDMFHTKKADIGDPSMQTTEYLNPNLPQPKVKDDLEGKYESMLKSYGRIDDFTAVDVIDREDKEAEKEEYESPRSVTARWRSSSAAAPSVPPPCSRAGIILSRSPRASGSSRASNGSRPSGRNWKRPLRNCVSRAPPR